MKIKIEVWEGNELVAKADIQNTPELLFDDAHAEVGRLERFVKRRDENIIEDNQE